MRATPSDALLLIMRDAEEQVKHKKELTLTPPKPLFFTSRRLLVT